VLESKADLIDLEKICGILEHKIDNADIENAFKQFKDQMSP